ncbi:two pore channel [Anaeramoeba flamelloides]|uniref:Two pore channel n=1 Tax=Anaeramoeba flamelloides TaxID=1746091 RepID=A0AAV7ZN72_9EUKA|nr:two pore channel [Anaeramoeba flamelloides]
MPAYRKNGYVAIFFGAFLIIELYLFGNLVLGAIYEKYRISMAKSVKKQKRQEWRAVLSAFKRIDSTNRGYLTRKQWRILLKYIKTSLNPEGIDLWFEFLDIDDDGYIDKFNFLHIIELLHCTIKQNVDTIDDQPLYHQRIFGTVKQFMRRLVKSKKFKILIDIGIVINIALTIFFLEKNDEQSAHSNKYLNIMFVSIFTLEMVCKMIGYGLRRYFKDIWNRFDFLIVVLSFIGLIIVISGKKSLFSFISFVTILRTLSLLKTINLSKKLRKYFIVAKQCIPAFLVYGLILFFIYYLFALVGMAIFSGKIYESNPKLAKTGYLAADYIANSFNDFPKSIVVLFELMIINNWFVIVEGHVAVTNWGSYFFFITFYFITIIVILNIVIAFILEVFQWKHDNENKMLYDQTNVKKTLGELESRTKQFLRAQGIKKSWKLEARPKIFTLFQNIFQPKYSLSIQEVQKKINKINGELSISMKALNFLKQPFTKSNSYDLNSENMLEMEQEKNEKDSLINLEDDPIYFDLNDLSKSDELNI